MESLQKSKESLENLSKSFEASVSLTKKLHNISNILTLVILLVLLIYVFLFYSSFKRSFTAENFAISVKKHAPEVAPQVLEKVSVVITEIYPVYLNLAKEKVTEALPRWAEIADMEVAKLIDNVGGGAQKQLVGVMESVVKKQDGAFRKVFPKLSQDEINNAIGGLVKDLDKDFATMAKYLYNKFSNQVFKLKRTIEKFPTKGLPANKGELAKLFIHNWLLLLDKEVMGR